MQLPAMLKYLRNIPEADLQKKINGSGLRSASNSRTVTS